MRIWRFTCFSLLFGFLLSSVPELTGSAELKIAVEFGTTIRINTSAGKTPQCKVCIRPNTQQLCQSSVVLRSDTLLDFSCSQPENVFTVQIISDNVIYNIEPKEHKALQKFNRTFIWNLKPPATKSLHLNFSSTGLLQIQPTDSCPDKHVYMLAVENVSIGRFCQNGTIRQVDVRNAGKLSLEVSGGRALDKKFIGVSLGRLINSLANFHVVLPEKSSTQDFFAPNAFPENTETMWYFTVPQTYYTDVHILSYTVPTCLQPENIPTMKYTWQGKEPLVKLMNVSQPSVEPGNFNLSIKNCKMSGPQPPSQGLMVHFQISAIKRSKGLHGIPKAQEEEEDPHTYVYIDETLVYSHLLNYDAEKEEYKEATTDESDPPLSAPALPVRNAENLVTKSNALLDNELCGYVQGQSTTSGSPKTSEEEGNYETRLCV
ncbi:CUB domain-containing protein 1-like [Sinocyclocheilus grahami]|uniref:CUB domain-containing protein 1-like n=1 Tax=Sinocyclocheilus grahami TaxID=75366 RepID=UPI0007AD2A87|nr:PREDICTED: CUB domain-containing protein 1-like [Sinocyclocheilus grahami]